MILSCWYIRWTLVLGILRADEMLCITLCRHHFWCSPFFLPFLNWRYMLGCFHAKLFFAGMKIREAVCVDTPNLPAALSMAPHAGTITPSYFVDWTRMCEMIAFTTSLFAFFGHLLWNDLSYNTLVRRSGVVYAFFDENWAFQDVAENKNFNDDCQVENKNCVKTLLRTKDLSVWVLSCSTRLSRIGPK
jgi:hypothetical protein